MAKYFDYGRDIIYDTSLAKNKWTNKSGNTLYLSSKGKYYLIISDKMWPQTEKLALAFLLFYGFDIPQNLLELSKEIIE